MRDVSLLWALRSPCNLGCTYCYFGTIEDHRAAPPTSAGALSHLSRADLPAEDVMAFAASMDTSRVERVFLAGGEPLIWPHTPRVVELLKAAGVQVVLCTNGIPLNRPEITAAILDLQVDAVSVSLDSPDPAYNDWLRPSRNKVHGWGDVVSGIHALRTARGSRAAPRIGIYAAITRLNIDAVHQTAAMAADLGLDYFVPQPISLAATHNQHDVLSIRRTDLPQLREALDELYRAGLPVGLPGTDYPQQFLTAVSSDRPTAVPSCFGGDTLYFIQPDGSLWPCPSFWKIAATARRDRRSIRGRTAADLFGEAGPGRAPCPLFSRDCVSMWPLTDFGRFLDPDSKEQP